MTLVNKIASVGYRMQSALRFTLSAACADDVCCRCGKKSYGSVLCADCSKWFLQHSLKAQDCCPYCAKPLVSEIGLCMQCRQKRVLQSADSVHSLYTYRQWCKNLLFAWKTEGRRSAALLFAQAVYKALPKDCRTIVPVPPRPGKIRARGWDQIDDLCRILSFCYGIQVLGLLERKTALQQKKMDREGRLQLSARSYCIKESALRKKNKSALEEVVLLDDVITTGATVEACASLLKAYGIGKVHVLSLFIVD